MEDENQNQDNETVNFVYLNQFTDQLSLDQETREKSKTNLIDLLEKENTVQDNLKRENNLAILSACSIYFAGHQVCLKTISGQKCNNSEAISISRVIQILPREIDIYKFLHKLCDSMRKIKLETEKQVILNKNIKVYLDSCSIFNKYSSFFKSLKLSFKQKKTENNSESSPLNNNNNNNNVINVQDFNKQNYEENLHSLIWLTYLNMKNEVHSLEAEGDQILFRNLSVLITTLLHSIVNLPSCYTSEQIENILQSKFENKDERFQQIKQIIVDALSKNSIEDQTLSYYEEQTLKTMQGLRMIMSKRKSIDISNEMTLANQELPTPSFQFQNVQKQLDFQNLFEIQYIEKNIDRFKHFYKMAVQEVSEQNEQEQQIQQMKFDESCFLRGIRQYTPRKETTEIVQNLNQKDKKDLSCHRYIIYDQINQNNTNDIQNQSLKDAKNNMMGNGFQSPKIQFKQLPGYFHPAQSPITPVLERYNWINMYSKNEFTPKFDKYMKLIGQEYKDKVLMQSKEIISRVHQKLGKTSEEANETRINRNLMFFINVLEKMITSEEQLIVEQSFQENIVQLVKNQDFLLSLLAMCIDCFCFIHNLDPDLNIILQNSLVTPQDYWRVISNFARFDKQIHQSIMEHLFNRERLILLYYAWSDGKSLASLMQSFFAKNQQQQSNKQINNNNQTNTNSTNNNNQTNTTSTNNNNSNYTVMPYHQILCKRIFNHIALRVYEVCKLVSFNDQHSEKVWKVMKFICEKENHLLFYHYIDQLIICSVYAVFMANRQQFKERLEFKRIISVFEDLAYFKKELIVKVKVKDPENDQNFIQIDIISFYNKVYLPPVKEFFRDIKDNKINIQENQQSNTPDISSTNKFKHLASPLRESIPRSFLLFSPICKNIQESPQTKKQQFPSPFLGVNHLNQSKTPIMTPISKKLYAFGESLESPAKKISEYKNSNLNTPNSYRQIIFDDYDKDNHEYNSSNRPNKLLARKILKQSQESIQLSPKFGVISQFEINGETTKK